MSYHVSLSDGRVVRRHVEHIRIRTCDSSDQNTESDIEIPTVDTSESSTVTVSSAPKPQADNPPQPPRKSGQAVARQSITTVLCEFQTKEGV